MAKRSKKTTPKKTAKKNATKSTQKDPRAWEKGLTLCQIASRITWKLKGDLKNLQKAYLRVAGQLVRVRDERLWAEMINPRHPDIEDYAQKRLGLKKTSLYRYLLAYDWVSKNHPEWLDPDFKDTIPDMADIIDLVWIDKELKKDDLAEKKKEALTDLKEKAEAGDLKKGELGKLLRQRNRSQSDYAKSILTELRSLRKRAAQRNALSSEAMTQFDVLIGTVAKNVSVSSVDFGYPSAFA
jgi:hypothetical protein